MTNRKTAVRRHVEQKLPTLELVLAKDHTVETQPWLVAAREASHDLSAEEQIEATKRHPAIRETIQQTNGAREQAQPELTPKPIPT